jgi:peptide/nickel transport system substrate-binding protein
VGDDRVTGENARHFLEEVLSGRMTRRQLLVRATALGFSATAAGSLLAACGSSTSTATSSSAAGTTPTNGGTLRVAWQGEPTGLDPAVSYEVESWEMENMLFSGLVKYASASGVAGTQLVGDIATEVPSVANGGITNGGKTYTFHLRSGVKFAPPVNRAITADDVKWSIERMMRVPRAPATYFYDGIVGATEYGATNSKATQITGIKVIDPTTIEFDLTHPDPTFLYEISLPFCYVVDKGTVAQYGTQVDRHPVGTGPFAFVSWTPGQEIVMKRNPNYFDASQVRLDGIDFTFSADPSTALLQLERGNIDVLGDGVPPASYVQVTHNPQFKNDVISAPQIAWFYLFINTTIKPFNNVLVRQSLNYAVNTQKLLKILAGQAAPLNQIYPAGMPGHDSSASFYSYDPVKAKAVLAQAGFPNGFKVTLYADNVDPVPSVAQSVQYDLQQVGLNVSIKLLDRSTYFTLTETKGNPCALGVLDWYQDFPDPADWYGPLFSKSAAETNGGNNQSWWYSPQAETIYAQTLVEPDPAKRIQLFQQIQKIIMAQAPVVPLYQPVFNGMASSSVGGFYVHPVWQLKYDTFWKK